MKIYQVASTWPDYKPKVVSTEAKETPKTYRIEERSSAFGYSTVIDKGRAYKSPKEAITAYTLKIERSISALKDNLAREEEELAEAKKLQ